MMIPLAVLLLLRITLVVQVLLCFHMKLKFVFFSFYEKLCWSFDVE